MDYGIGEVARRTGIKIPTIRYYETVGLLSAPARTAGKQRRYGHDDVDRLNFVRHARELGFEIEDIRELLTLSSQPDQSCGQVDVIARRHLSAVESRIAKLTSLQGELQRMIDECSQGKVCDCRVIGTISGADQPQKV